MALMPKGQREQVLVLVSLVAVLAAGAYWYFLYQPKAAEMAVQRARLEKIVAVNQSARAELAKGSVDQLRAQLAGYRHGLEMIRTLVPTTNEVPALLEQVSTAARRQGLEIAAVDPQPVIAGEEYDTYRYEMGVVGGYHALAGFLTNVGSLTRIVAPMNLRLIKPTNPTVATQKVKKDVAAIEARFLIQTYVARKGVGDDDAAMPITTSGATPGRAPGAAPRANSGAN